MEENCLIVNKNSVPLIKIAELKQNINLSLASTRSTNFNRTIYNQFKKKQNHNHKKKLNQSEDNRGNFANKLHFFKEKKIQDEDNNLDLLALNNYYENPVKKNFVKDICTSCFNKESVIKDKRTTFNNSNNVKHIFDYSLNFNVFIF